jgi:hypothetical protein
LTRTQNIFDLALIALDAAVQAKRSSVLLKVNGYKCNGWRLGGAEPLALAAKK